MTSRSRRTSVWPALWAGALAFVLAAALPAGAADGDAPEAAAAETVRTVTVGKATITLRLAPPAAAKRDALVAAFQQATAAHLTGGEPFVTPKAEPVELPGGQRMMVLPVEMMHTMFVGPAGKNYCSDSTVTVKRAAAGTDGEGR